MKYMAILFRFSVYGFATFAAFGYLVQNPYVTGSPASSDIILYLGIAGAASFPISAASAIMLFEIFKELIRND